jgi:hypothetical protein
MPEQFKSRTVSPWLSDLAEKLIDEMPAEDLTD